MTIEKLKKCSLHRNLLQAILETSIHKKYVYFQTILPFSMMVIMYFAPILLTIPYIMYPVIMSVVAIEKKEPERTKWLIFWLIYNTLIIAEVVFHFLLKLIPGYSILKIVYLTWCMAPVTSNGSVVTYHLLRPVLLEQILTIDEYVLDLMYKLQVVVRERQRMVAMTTTLGSAALSNPQSPMHQQTNQNQHQEQQNKMKKIE